MGGWTYIARCRDDSLYVGSTCHADIQARIDEHNDARYLGYTSNRRPVVLTWSKWFDDLTEAHAMERQLKGWSREKKLALINSEVQRIRTFAKRPFARTRVLLDAGEQPPVMRMTGRKLRQIAAEAQSTGAPHYSLSRHPEVRAKRVTHASWCRSADEVAPTGHECDAPQHDEALDVYPDRRIRHPEVRAKRATKDE